MKKFLGLVKALFVAPFLFLIGGTVYGKASFFKFSKFKKVGPWLLLELSAADREKLRILANDIAFITDDIERGQQWIAMKMMVIASCAVNKRGWYLYDPLENDDLNRIADFPDRLIEEALEAIHKLNDMPWLVVRESSADPESCDEPVNP